VADLVQQHAGEEHYRVNDNGLFRPTDQQQANAVQVSVNPPLHEEQAD
jgi:hypothetical protein